MTIDTAKERERLARVVRAARTGAIGKHVTCWTCDLAVADAVLAETAAQAAEIERLKRQIADITKVIEGDWDFPVEQRWRTDGKPSKHDQCPHGHFMWQDCGLCVEDAIRSILEREP